MTSMLFVMPMCNAILSVVFKFHVLLHCLFWVSFENKLLHSMRRLSHRIELLYSSSLYCDGNFSFSVVILNGVSNSSQKIHSVACRPDIMESKFSTQSMILCRNCRRSKPFIVGSVLQRRKCFFSNRFYLKQRQREREKWNNKIDKEIRMLTMKSKRQKKK